MKIEVTQEDITNGKRGNTSKCAVGLALNRVFPGEEITVGAGLVLFKNKMKFDLPRDVNGFIDAFDKLEPVAPFSFDITFEMPTEATR